MFTKSLDIAGPAGRLEAVLMEPSGTPRAAAVLCHAHPLHGGVMHFKLLYRVAKLLQRHGVAVLRFNFRGVGRSEGEHDGGRGEQEDVRAALDEIERSFPDVPVLLGGFSFGAVMAFRVGARDPRPRALLLMGLPVSVLTDGRFASEVTTPRLFLQGAADEFGDEEAITEFVTPLPEPKKLAVVPESDHFFDGHLEAVETAVSEWLPGALL